MSHRILYKTSDGGVAVIVPSPEFLAKKKMVNGVLQNCTIDDCLKDVPDGIDSRIIATSDIPTDRIFRDAWMYPASGLIETSLVKAKTISHDKRRIVRKIEFEPLDIQATIPNKAAEAEKQRQSIRDKYSIIQNDIDRASNVDTLKTIVSQLSD